MAARLSLLSSIVRHVTTKTWDQPNRQIWVSSCGTSTLIYCCIGTIIAILIHCLLALLTFLTNHLTPAWVDVQQAKSGAVSAVIFFASGVLDALTVVVGDDRDLLLELFKEHACLAKVVSAFNVPHATTLDLNRYKVLLHLYGVPDFTSLDALRHYAYTHAMVRKFVNDSFILIILSPNWCCS